MSTEDIARLEELEAQIQTLTESLNKAINEEAMSRINLINHSSKVVALKNSLKQVEGMRDSLKKILSIIPR